MKVGLVKPLVLLAIIFSHTIAMKYSADSHGPLRMNPSDFGDLPLHIDSFYRLCVKQRGCGIIKIMNSSNEYFHLKYTK